MNVTITDKLATDSCSVFWMDEKTFDPGDTIQSGSPTSNDSGPVPMNPSRVRKKLA